MVVVEVFTQVVTLVKQEDLEEDLVKVELSDQVYNLLNQEIQELLVLETIQELELQVHHTTDTLAVVVLEL